LLRTAALIEPRIAAYSLMVKECRAYADESSPLTLWMCLLPSANSSPYECRPGTTSTVAGSWMAIRQ
jgi:hypothetical protein